MHCHRLHGHLQSLHTCCWGRVFYILVILSEPVISLTGDLDALKNQVFVLKEGIEYKVKITFKVRVAAGRAGHVPAFQRRPLTCSSPQVNKEIVSGLKCLHHTYRRGLRGEAAWRAA